MGCYYRPRNSKAFTLRTHKTDTQTQELAESALRTRGSAQILQLLPGALGRRCLKGRVWAEPTKVDPPLVLDNLHCMNIRLHNWGFYFLDPPRGLGARHGMELATPARLSLDEDWLPLLRCGGGGCRVQHTVAASIVAHMSFLKTNTATSYSMRSVRYTSKGYCNYLGPCVSYRVCTARMLTACESPEAPPVAT